ncbi:rac GTPase-activating protein 1 isoform X1 [Scleropages formosus]|uniref:rac GTPase-activating protein 1 isoform X1 n=1 Tax=Scleropages formosus TaxID=113540 RepID=UPI0008790558|nr:rac GTPase-activating protein 1 isoform X1 [Scleropages formosus]XP_018616065.1 rac GTPase-activating protein 1 isoform X1 [Scleropages formosus]XP_018616066.1 rac GTPase-activating protein 1 isoform X1 [Scleropages formosus]XP_018616067.1 rac GTPase-activating protein 1 isoform X1 [Scleropages formosus]
MDTAVLTLHSLFENLRAHVEILNEGIEPQFIQIALNFEECRRKWLRLEQELGSCKEVLAKAETERGALEVKLKHARNQVDVEIRRRQKAEAECEKLDRQIQLIRELLVTEGSSNSIQLNEEQRSALAFLNARSQATPNPNTSRRLTTIDESASILSDISYDKTDDSLDWDSSLVRTVRLKKREKRRSSRNHVDGPPCAAKKSRSTGRTSEKGNESIVAKTTLTVPADGGPIEAVSTIEAVPYWTRSRRRTALQEWDAQSENVFKPPTNPNVEPSSEPMTPHGNGGVRMHEFISKTVIKPETCVPCGKRIKFGKLSFKCRDCRVVTHPECRERCPLPCIPTMVGTPVKMGEGTLADYVPAVSPMIPSLVVHCVNEIEQRGLHETGLYRVSGVDRTVKELKEKFLRGKTVPLLSKVDDIHAICGLLKDFLRNLKEPLLTFRLNRAFMEAAETPDDDNSIALMYQTISDLPQANRDTLAFLMIHLQRVAQSPDTKMDISNLARVFGPTIVGHAVPEPESMTILQDTKRQPKVVERLLSLPVEYWHQFIMADQENAHPDHLIIENVNSYATPDQKVSMLGPLTTPEHQMSKTPSSSSLSQRMKSTLSRTTPKFGSKSKSSASISRQGNFFASPLLK